MACNNNARAFVNVENPKSSLEPSKLMLKAFSHIPVSHFILAFSLLPLSLLYNFLEIGHFLRRLFAGILASENPSTDAPLGIALRALGLIPIYKYYLAFAFILLTCFYNFMEIHLLHDLLNGFRGGSVSLTFHSRSDLYKSVVSQCRTLHGRYLATPWLSSPHLQTVFVSFFGNPPKVSYRRELFLTSDGGTIALDWLKHSDVIEDDSHANDNLLKKIDTTPIVVVIPGLSSDSASPYIQHIALRFAKHGRNVCVSNHRGFGGVPMTSDCFPNGGWTDDLRQVVEYLRGQYPEAPLFAVGTSIGANILVKYLGEDGIKVPLVGAAAVGCPWDLLATDRFLRRRFAQRFYNNAIAVGLKTFTELHRPIVARLADWEGIQKSRTLREFDCSATCLLGNFKSADAYYRKSSCADVVGNVAVPLLCINSLDDPICPVEAIPWEDCRANKNIVLATTEHGGHIAHYEGLSANSLWYVRAVDEFLGLLHSKRFILRKKEMRIFPMPTVLESSIAPCPHSNSMVHDKPAGDQTHSHKR